MKHFKQWILKPLLLIVSFVALTTSTGWAASYYGIRKASGDQIDFSWNSNGYYQCEIPENSAGLMFDIKTWGSGEGDLFYGWGSQSSDCWTFNSSYDFLAFL